ncbi:hypothetical protein [Agromyces larvae]|uniref:DUF3039 domain-containing protein n=1 Tax=Agromyces larvae TaxID=2929802 RepID=A0ABY4C1Z3_9MICO|nr:hypothetical protein [Agromyces larvae]UOE45500.1 hypothetical protein MTO99_07010 [Agromyces larvae]
MSTEARAEAERRHAAGELYALEKSRLTTFVEGAEWQASRPVTDAEVEAAARALNVEGWTCNGGEDEPGNYDSCPDCKRVCDPLARVALEAARTTRQEANDAE